MSERVTLPQPGPVAAQDASPGAPQRRHLGGAADHRRGSGRRGANGKAGNLLAGRWWLRRPPNAARPVARH